MRILKKYKTIPEHLYVERDADKQLKIIIEDMESPGYVLVARQMGKTNLLLNAQRIMNNENRCFVYIDLSNTFENEKELYRGIIKNIISQNKNIFSEVKNEINEIQTDELNINDEYIESLEVLLNHFDGDIIIILDEIDALRTATYSDHIFAQIRSLYFARTSFPFLEKLTYILSGVIDPSELIKDRNKSPFNIGTKIYLNDFTFDEHNLFIEKSQLEISADNSAEIFSWTHGNPRLTFDICSEIESNIIDGLSIDIEFIQELIRKKYLVNFDIPPVDHIRELVKSNKTVQDAIVNIQKGINNISDETKKTLYLYGIMDSSFDKKTVIKNKIIEKSLHLKWLESIAKQNKNTFAYGVTLYEDGDYKEAIKVFKLLLDDTSVTIRKKDIYNYYLGRSYYKLRKLDDAITYLSFEYGTEKEKRKAQSLLGRCYLERESIKDALDIFRDIVKIEADDLIYYYALLNLIAHMSKEESKERMKLGKIFFKLLNHSENIEKNELNKLKTLALYYQYKIYVDTDNHDDARKKLLEVKKYTSKSNQLAFTFLEYEETKNESLKKELVDTMIDNKIIFNKGDEYPISFNQERLLKYLDLIFDYSELELFERLLAYSEKYLFDKSENKFEIIYELSRIYEHNKIDYLNYILEYGEDVNNVLLLKVFRDLALITKKNTLEFLNYFEDYLDIFKKEKPKPIDKDILLFALAISELSRRSLGAKEPHRQELFDHGLELCSLMEKRMENIEDEGLLFESLIIYYWHASIYYNINDQKKSSTNREKILFYCDKTLKIINTSKRENTSMIDEEGLNLISKQMIDIKASYKIRVPIVNKTKQGRNKIVKVEYIDGTIKEGKYKKFVADIIEERCKIIE